MPMPTVRLDETATADQVAALHAVGVAALAVDDPDAPPPALEDVDGDLRTTRPDRRALHWLVTENGTPVATARLALPLEDVVHTGFLGVVVHPDHRRRGLGTGLVRAALVELAAVDRRAFLIEADTGTPAAAFCDALGLTEAQAERSSILRLAEVDRDRIAGWAAAAHPGYRLAGWSGRCPDDLLDAYAVAKNAMNDAPTGDMDWGDFTYDGDDLRVEEDSQRRRNRDFRVVAAVHEESGAVAGFTELAISNWAPARAAVEDTAVVPAHRGSGLGLWVKAELVRRVLAERPDVREMMTRNALTNGYMWRINEQLGFRTSATTVERQGRVADLTARLGAVAQQV
jgi:GNAT superfamily N-acetyltransferase